MRHLNSVNKLNKTASHRKAMLSNLSMSILDKEHVITTLPKAKVVRGVVERLITFAKKGDVHSMRIAAKTVRDKTILKKLFTDIAPSFKGREGGYTRILKLGVRPGDNASQCIIELTGRNSQELAQARKKKNRAAATPDATGKAPAAISDAKFEEVPKTEEGKETAEVKKPKAKAPKAAKKADAGDKTAKEPKAAKETKKKPS